MKNFKLSEEDREKYKEALDIGYSYDQVFDEIEQIVNEYDGWMLKKDTELIEGNAYLVSDGWVKECAAKDAEISDLHTELDRAYKRISELEEKLNYTSLR